MDIYDTPIYVVEVNGQKRKSFDLIALKQFIEAKKFKFSVLNLNPESVRGSSAIEVIVDAQRELIKELEDAVDIALGLKQPPQEETVEEGEEQFEETAPKEPITVTKSGEERAAERIRQMPKVEEAPSEDSEEIVL